MNASHVVLHTSLMASNAIHIQLSLQNVTVCWILSLSRQTCISYAGWRFRSCIVFAVYRQELKQLIGSFEEAAVPTAAETARSLATFSRSTNTSTGGKGTEPKTEYPEIFGAGIDFRQPKVFNSADEAVLAMCDTLPGSATAAQSRWDSIALFFGFCCS